MKFSDWVTRLGTVLRPMQEDDDKPSSVAMFAASLRQYLTRYYRGSLDDQPKIVVKTGATQGSLDLRIAVELPFVYQPPPNTTPNERDIVRDWADLMKQLAVRPLAAARTDQEIVTDAEERPQQVMISLDSTVSIKQGHLADVIQKLDDLEFDLGR